MGFFLTLLLFAVLFVVAELIRPAPDLEDAKPAGLGDFHFPTATEGRSVPLIWGTVQVDGPNVVWYGDLQEVAIEEEVDTGLFSSEDVVIGFQYFLGVQLAFCRGPDCHLLRFWVGEVEVFNGDVENEDQFTINKPFLFGGDDRNGGFSGTFTFYGGSQTQAVDSYLATQQQTTANSKTPAYRGTCYLVTDGRCYVGNSTSIKVWKFELQRIPNAIGVPNPNGGLDANPVEVIYEILTDTDWGLGQDSSLIDTTNFSNAGTTCSTEGNGFSMVLDSPTQAIEIIRTVEQQIDGSLFFDGRTNQWKINLARADYDPDTIPEINPTNLVDIKSFTRGSWEETTNQVRVAFNQRDDEYKQTYGSAQDMANVRVQDGVNVSTTQNFPGCKTAALANQIAWRSLRSLSYPLAKASLVVDRTFWDAQPSDVFAFTDPELGFARLPMRVTRVDRGDLLNNRVVLDLVQDIFFFQVGAFGDPFGSGWTPPADNLQPFPSNEQIGFEAPRAFCQKDTINPGVADRIWGAGQKQGVEVTYDMVERHAAGGPSGAFTKAAGISKFMKIGTLVNALDAGSAIPLATLEIAPWPGLTQADIESAFTDNPSITNQGKKLQNLILLDNGTSTHEFMFVRSAANAAGNNVNLTSVYRGALDTTQVDHLTGASVYLVFVGGGMSGSTTIPPTDNVHMKLLPVSRSDAVDEASAAQIAFQMDNRYRRPYPPPQLSLDGTVFATTTPLEGTGSGAEAVAIDLDYIRRDFRSGDLNGDELDAILTDAASTFGDYPSANSSDHDLEVRNDPDGANTLLFTDTITAASEAILRLRILQATDGVLPTRMRLVLTHNHTVNSVVYSSIRSLSWDFDVTSALTGQFNFGALDQNDISNTYTADAAGQHDFTLSSAFTAGDVEYRIDTGGGFGAWTQLIAAGGTTGNIAGVAIGDDIQVRHLSSDSSALKQLDMDAPGAGTDGYAVLFT